MTYLTRLSEDEVLEYFWRMASAGTERVALLKQLSDVSLMRPSDWDFDAIRQGLTGRHAGVTLFADACFGCRSSERRLYWHHIIQVQHGGSNNPRNLVAICHACHQSIHPWLVPPTSLENRRGWTWIGDWAARVKERLRTVIRSRG